MRKLLSCLVLLLVLAVGLHATALTDLGPGLAYLRVETLAQPLELGATALVLDLRYIAIDEKAPAALKILLAQQPIGLAWFVLVSPATPAALAPVIAAAPVRTLGAPGSVPEPQVIVHTDALADRRAYEAFTAGTPLAQLISGKIDKERYDEATLVQEFQAGVPAPQPPPAVDPTTPKTTVPATTPATPPVERLIDRVLQRAVNLHTAMLALRR